MTTRSRSRGKWRRRRFQQLQWKLMRSYMVVTVSAVLIIYLLLGIIWGYSASRPSLSLPQLTQKAQEIAPRISRPLSASSPDTAAIVQTLRPLLQGRMSAAVTDRGGKVLVCEPSWFVTGGTSLFSQTDPKVKTLARAALANNAPQARLSAKNAAGNSITVVPVLGAKRQVVSLLFIEMPAPVNLRDFSLSWIFLLLINGLVVGFFATVVGLGFGFLNARQLTRRLNAISEAADAWSRGEFSAVARDNSEDELGQLARRLNHMADELQELVALRQNLATSEERNRLSRELHDTVKQQIFATTMQVSAARMLLDQDVDLARARLIEGERLASEAQHELTAILEQLRPGSYLPPPLADENLGRMLPAYVRDWSRQNGIAVELKVEPTSPLSPIVQQALFRITQETLANVARHSQASKVLVQLKLSSTEMSPQETVLASVAFVQKGALNATNDVASGRRIELTIQDNGCGFDLSQAVGGLGLQSMRERSEALPQGSLVVESQVGHGTRIEVTCSDTNAVDSNLSEPAHR